MTAIDLAAPHKADPIKKETNPTSIIRRRPKLSLSPPAHGTIAVEVIEYEFATHAKSGE